MSTVLNASPHKKTSFTLDELNIGSSIDPYGEERLTIKLSVDPLFGVADCQAIFDRTSQQWKLVTSVHTTLADGKKARWKPATPQQSPAVTPAASWTSNLPRSEHVDFFVNGVDWAATQLGPLDRWSVSLQTCCHFVFADSRPAILYWGPELIAICNAYSLEHVSGLRKNPKEFMGRPFKEIWPELWFEFKPMLDNISASGVALDTLNVNLFPQDEEGFVCETYYKGSFLPIRGESGNPVGFYNRAIETTKEVIYERWTSILNEIAAPTHMDGETIWEHVFHVLSNNERDFPMAFAYSADDNPLTSVCLLKLQQSIGIPSEGHQSVPEECDLYEGLQGFVPFYRKAKSTGQAVILHKSDGSLPLEALNGFNWKGFHEPSTSVAIIPIATTDKLLGIMVFGLNPRRRYDSDYSSFVNNFARQASATITSVLDREESNRRAARLTRQLADSEKQIRDLAEYGPVGILRLAPNGKITWANPQFYEITGHARADDEHYELSFMSVVDERDEELTAKSWPVLTEEHKSTSIAVRLKRKWKPPPGPHLSESEEQPVWVLANAYPVVEDGHVTSVAASVADISIFKWAETVQSRVAEDAEAAKRLQETFIDVVSHEMRNPLSAITQLADGISNSLDDLNSKPEDLAYAKSLIQQNVDSGKIILLCAAHQKRIIDDVLTLSKLDSMMLSITPIAVQPRAIVASVLQMFEAEFESSSIAVESTFEDTYDSHLIDWVFLDPSRLTQIFINLITNAVKFTKLEPVRRIRIRSVASLEKPPNMSSAVNWFKTNQEKRDLTLGHEWGDGEPVYLGFEISDTGKGLKQEEMNKLFGRFQQATAKTHIQYGGSGLGLFISRELTETQGGQIGVFSSPGKGSTFSFYIKARRTTAPGELQKPSAPFDPVSLVRRMSKPSITLTTSPKADVLPESGELRLMLVEDNVVNAQVLAKQLQKAGCNIQIANHGLECLEMLEKSQAEMSNDGDHLRTTYDCILMDVEMPVMDGLTATKHIRRMENAGKLAKQYVIAITANARDEQINETLRVGVDAVQPKPFKVRELLDKIHEIRRKSSG